jgi:hypothetical protein
MKHEGVGESGRTSVKKLLPPQAMRGIWLGMRGLVRSYVTFAICHCARNHEQILGIYVIHIEVPVSSQLRYPPSVQNLTYLRPLAMEILPPGWSTRRCMRNALRKAGSVVPAIVSFCGLSDVPVSILDYVPSNCGVIGDYWIDKDLKGSSRDVIKLVYRNLSGETEEYHEKSSRGRPCPGINSNLTSPLYISRLLPLHHLRLLVIHMGGW